MSDNISWDRRTWCLPRPNKSSGANGDRQRIIIFSAQLNLSRIGNYTRPAVDAHSAECDLIFNYHDLVLEDSITRSAILKPNIASSFEPS